MKKLVLALSYLLACLGAAAQCPDVYATRKKVSSSFHSSLMIDYTGAVLYWGESSNPVTGATAATPGIVSTSSFSGTPLAVAASSVVTGTGGHQMYLLTSSALYGWGSTAGSAGFTAFSSIALPATLNGASFTMTAGNIEFITSSGGGLAIVTKIDATTNGEVFVMLPSATGGGSAYTYGDGTTSGFNTSWHQVKTSATTYLQGVTRLSHSQKALMAIGASNAIYAWGEKVWVGTASAATDRAYATQITTLPSVTPVDINIISKTAYAAANAQYASQFILGNNGKVYGIGEGYHGVLGQGNETDATSWTAVKDASGTADLTNIIQISSNNSYVYASAYYSIGALNSDGQLFLWGDNSYSMIGGTNGFETLPKLPPNFDVNDARVGYFCMGGHTTLAFLQGSNRFCYIGHRTQGSMGDGTTTSTTKSFYDCINTPNAYACPPPPPLGCPAASAHELLASSVNGTVVINGQPALSYWGQGSNSADAGVSVPLPLTLYEYTGSPLGVAASGVSTTNGTQMWILSTTGLWGWGYSANTINAAVGNTSLTKMALPSGVTISNVAFIRSSKGGLALVTTSGSVWIKAGAGSSCDVSVYGDASTALDNSWHQVTTAAATPLLGVTELSFTGTAAMAITGAGTVYVWGVNTLLGNNTAATTRNRAALLTLHPDFTALQVPRKAEIIQTGTNAAAQFLLGANGKVYSIGGNLNGVLGIGNTTDQTSWNMLSLTNVSKLSSNNPFPNSVYSIGALTATGTLYLWGSNANGVLGGGATASFTTPTIPALSALGTSVTAVDNINGFELGGQQTIIFTKPLAANPDNKFLFAGVNAGGAKGDVSPVPTTATFTSFTFGASVINCAGSVFNLSGNVYYDANGMNDAGGGLISGTGITNVSGAPSLFVNLLDEAGVVINSTQVGANGSYSFPNLPAANYTIQLSATAGGLFNPAQPSTLPDAWAFAGEQIGTIAGAGLNTGVNANTGRISVVLGDHTSNVNLGVERRPVADTKSFTVLNTQFRGQSTPPSGFPVVSGYKAISLGSAAFGGYASSGNGSMSGSDVDDCSAAGGCNTGSNRTFRIDTIAANTQLWYNNGGTVARVLAGQSIGNFNVANLVAYGQMGSGSSTTPLGFTYRLVDEAGAASAPAGYSISTGATALPVILSSFDAQLTPDCTASLTWSTGTETRVAGFAVQRSADGQGFETIARAAAKGAGSVYNFTDRSPVRGNNYYRLMMEDLDGSLSFSKVASISASCLSRGNVTVAPNPTSGNVVVSGVMSGDRISVFTAIGNAAASHTCTADGTAAVNLGNFPAGIYILRLQDAAGESLLSIRVEKY
jgi:alpha-tubulin suppressor-like RCC1 family protein